MKQPAGVAVGPQSDDGGVQRSAAGRGISGGDHAAEASQDVRRVPTDTVTEQERFQIGPRHTASLTDRPTGSKVGRITQPFAA
jgi:hypothetical protein